MTFTEKISSPSHAKGDALVVHKKEGRIRGRWD